jgi:predicted phosphodiesterase
MTRLGILSDIHGNNIALEAVLDDMVVFDVDQVVCAGDAVNWGPHNADVVQRIVDEGWVTVRGNNELYLLDQDTPRARAGWNDYTMARWTRQQLGPSWINVIAAWPDTLTLRFRDAPTLRVVHGSPRSHFEGLYPRLSDDDLTEKLNDIEETTLVSGHTHLPLDRQVGRWHLVNPGSVGVPLMGVLEATYMILDGDWSGWQATLRHVPIDPAPVLHDLERLRFAESCGVTGELLMDEYRTARPHVMPFLAWRNQFRDESDEALLARFRAEVDSSNFTSLDYQIDL